MSHLFGKATGIELDPADFDPLVDAIRNQGARRERERAGSPRAERAERERPRAERPRSSGTTAPADDPRAVLGLPPAPFALTEALIRERRRALTALFHPDATARGSGNAEAMRRVNDAATALLASLRR